MGRGERRLTWKTAGELVWEMVARLKRKGLGTVAETAPSQVSAGRGGAGQTIDGGSRVIWMIESGENSAPDQFRDLWNYGVSEGSKAVQLIGNPISHSENWGFIQSVSDRLDKSGVKDGFRREWKLLSHTRLSDLHGEGNQPKPIAVDRAAGEGRWKAMPFRVIPTLGQVSENSSKPSPGIARWTSKQVCDVFHNDKFWSYLASQSDDFAPESASCAALNSRLISSNAKVLARESTCDDVDIGNSIGSKSACCKCADIVIYWNLWPVFRQHAAWEIFYFAKCNGFAEAGTLKPKREATDAAEQVKQAQLHVRGPHLRAAASIAHDGQRSGE